MKRDEAPNLIDAKRMEAMYHCHLTKQAASTIFICPTLAQLTSNFNHVRLIVNERIRWHQYLSNKGTLQCLIFFQVFIQLNS